MRLLLSTLALSITGLASAQVLPYSQDFEGLVQTDPMALANDGWLVYGNVYDMNTMYLYGYGAFPAPNGSGGFCNVSVGQGGPAQGAQQLVVFSDYNNTDHALSHFVEGNTYREWTLDASDVGKTYRFSFDAKLGDLVAPSQALAFIKIINNTTFDLSGLETQDTSGIPTTWSSYAIEYTVDATQVGHLFQIGFLATAQSYDGSGVYYDNLELEEAGLEVGTNYCLGSMNSTGSAADISGSGSASVATNDLVLEASPVPNQPGIFYYGPSQVQLVFGNGFRCVGGTVGRLGVVNAVGNTLVHPLDVTMPPTAGTTITAGSTWYFQAWFRDPAAGGANFNLSDGLEVSFLP